MVEKKEIDFANMKFKDMPRDLKIILITCTIIGFIAGFVVGLVLGALS